MFQSGRKAVVFSLLKRAHRRDLDARSCVSFLPDRFSTTDTFSIRINQKRSVSSVRKNKKDGIENDCKLEFKSVREALQMVQKLVVDVDRSDGYEVGYEVGYEAVNQELVYSGVEQILLKIISQVEKGSLNPRGKHGKEISRLFEFVLYAYSRVDVPGISLFDKCEQVLETLKDWNLDIRSRHYENAIIAANKEGKYKEATDLFLQKIDPEAGYNPVSISIDAPHGLVAIALWAQQEGLPVADHVFDAVLKLSMVSPSDLKIYTLSAGTALSQAREWESAINYLYDSTDAKKFGQPIISAVMQTCLTCTRPDIALEAFDYGMNHLGIIGGGEWQWGGGGDRIDPLCRDMAMRAMKGKDGTSQMALDFFQEALDDNVTVSIEALQGIAEACERDRDWESALSLLLYIHDNHGNLNWIVKGNRHEIEERYTVESDNKSSKKASWISSLGPLLASVMRTCNANANFGTAIFCLLTIVHEADRDTKITFETSLGTKLTSYLSETKFCNDLLVATMTSLCGLRLYQNAIDIFETVEKDYAIQTSNDNLIFLSGTAWSTYRYALLENSKHGTVELGNPSMHAIIQMERLIGVAKSQEEGGPHSDTKVVEGNLAEVMKACTYIRESNLSFVLFNLVKMQMTGAKHDFASLRKITTTVDLDDGFAMRSDSLLAEVVSARKWGATSDTNNVFESLLRSEGGIDGWTNTCNAGISALIRKGEEKALDVFSALGERAMNPDMFVIVADHLAKEKRWDKVRDLYSTALKEGCYSEELSAIAMKAVVSSQVDKRIRVLREMVQDIAQYNGTNQEAWLRHNYWNMKRLLGFNYARLLMWWNDPASCHLDELNFAIEEIHERTADGSNVNYDTIRTIINTAREGFVNENLDKYKWIPSSQEEWKELLHLVIHQAQYTNHLDSKMIDDLVKSYLALDCREDCIQFVMDSIQKGERVNKRSLHQALEAAHLEASDAVNDLQMMLS